MKHGIDHLYYDFHKGINPIKLVKLMKNNKLLTGILAFVLVGGFGTAVFAQSTTNGEFTPSVFNPEEFTISSHGPLTIGLYPAFFGNTAAVLTGAGHTVIDPVDLTSPLTVDVLYIGRDGVGLSGAELTNVQNFIASGGIVLTEFSSTNLWFDGTLGSLSGTNVNGFFVPSGNVGGGNLVTVVDTSNPLSTALPATWISSEPIGVFQVFSGLDPSIKVAAEVQGTSEGDVAVAGCADVGGGTAVLFFSDFSDFFGETPEEEQLLLNAVDIQSCNEVKVVGGQLIPIDTTSLLLAGAQSTTWLIPVIISAVGIGLVLVSRKSKNS